MTSSTKKLWFLFAVTSAMSGVAACVSDAPSSDVDSGASGNDGSVGGDGGSSDAASGGDASSDSGGGASCDAAVPTSVTGVVQCRLDAGCSGGTPQCCFGNTANPSRCYTSGASCSTDSFVCDKASDCGSGTSVCCLSGTLGAAACPFEMPSAIGSTCGSTTDGGCAAGEIELCSASESCSGGKTCKALIATVSASGGPYTRSLGGCF